MANANCSGNISNDPEVVLLGLHVPHGQKYLLFAILLTTYLLTVAGNIVIVLTVATDRHLNSPMFFFLGNLSFLDIWYITTTIPNMLAGMLNNGTAMSVSACITQWYIFAWLATTECYMLTVMAYDRYAAICCPLHYCKLMGPNICLSLVTSAWLGSLLLASITMSLLRKLQFADFSVIDNFFCEFAPLVEAACSDTYVVRTVILFMSIFVLIIPFLLITVSYVYIISAILRISSVKGRHKAFSTCSSHLAVVVTYFGTLIMMYLVTSVTSQLLSLYKVLSLMYTVGVPMLNPIIYTMRNKEIREALGTLFSRKPKL